MADEIDKRLKKLEALVRRQREQIAGLDETIREMLTVLAGQDPIARVSDYWQGAWSRKYGSDYLWSYAKDKASIKRLLKTLTVDELKARIGAYLASEDPFYVRNQHAFGIFVGAINSFSHTPKRPTGCPHKPACDSEPACTRKRLDDARSPF